MKTYTIFTISAKLTRFFTLMLFLQLGVANSQAQFAYNFGGSGFDHGTEVGMDAAGNAYFVGEFNDTLDFDPGPLDHLLKNNNTDVFISSYDPFGTLRFAFKISGPFASHEGVGDIAVAANGDFVVTGHQPFGFIDFDPDPIEELGRSGELFIAGYTSEGKPRFAISPPGGQNTSSGAGHAVALDEAGNVYATGTFVTSLDFNPDDTTGVLPNAGNGDAFIASYDASGKYRYAFGFGGPGFDFGSGITVDSKANVYVAGYFGQEALFDPSDTNQDGNFEARTATSQSDMFLASFDHEGQFRFVKTFNGVNSILTTKKVALSIDGSDNIYMSGEVVGTIAFDPDDADGDGNVKERTANGLGGAFLASYTSEGLLRFATVLNPDPSASFDVFTDKHGVSIITGSFSGDIDSDPGAGEATLTSSRGSDVFVASYDSTGAYRTAFSLPSTGLSAGTGVAADSQYNIVLTGNLGGDLDLAYGASEDWRTSAGQNDIFMARYDAAGEISVGIQEPAEQPGSFHASAPYPNPFSDRTTIKVNLDKVEHVSITVFDALGRQVDQLHHGMLAAGKHSIAWNAASASNGLYFIRIGGGGQARTVRVVKVR